MPASLQTLSAALDLDRRFLSGMTKGNGVTRENILRRSMANALARTARAIGYASKERAARPIAHALLLLYVTADVEARHLSRFFARVKNPALKKLGQRLTDNLSANNVRGYENIRKRKDASGNFKPGATRVSEVMLTELLAGQPTTQRASAILTRHGSEKGFRFVCTRAALDKVLKKRLRRVGAVPSLYWQTAAAIHPPVRLPGMPSFKKRTAPGKSAVSRHAVQGNKISVTLSHKTDLSPAMFQKIERVAERQMTFYANRAAAEIVAAKELGKLL